MMLMIGERLNVFASKKVRVAVETRNEDIILAVAREQLDAGAQVLNVHAPERENLEWLLEVAGRTGAPLSLDSPDPDIIRALLGVPGVKFLNSLSAGRLELFGEAKARHVKVVGMLHDVTAEEVVEAAKKASFPLEDLYLDPAVMPVSMDASYARKLVERHHDIKLRFPGTRTIVGISNISTGMPRPTELKAAMLVTLLNGGLDAAICNPAELGFFVRAHAIIRDDGSGKSTIEYIRAFRKDEAARKAAQAPAPPK